MCGGEGTRLDADVEKPLVPVAGVLMVDRVCDALAASRVEHVHAAVSPNAPDTREHLAGRSDVTQVDTPGEGYVEDLGTAVDAVGTPVLTVAADLPLLSAVVVDRALDRAAEAGDGASVAVCVPAALKERLGLSVDAATGGLAPTGLNVVGREQERDRYLSYDARLAVNVNRPGDVAVADALAPEVVRDGP
ncbi:NTP transferase domain-containing protein [Haloarchaeobius sp. HRN-SO-5]|uniref:NTP transferase domain-containing protein n=1 Tax=Haloarchaeobius sp. HRN-SO-5 TaxID=3446118 RepID=UPI003EB8941D